MEVLALAAALLMLGGCLGAGPPVTVEGPPQEPPTDAAGDVGALAPGAAGDGDIELGVCPTGPTAGPDDVVVEAAPDLLPWLEFLAAAFEHARPDVGGHVLVVPAGCAPAAGAPGGPHFRAGPGQRPGAPPEFEEREPPPPAGPAFRDFVNPPAGSPTVPPAVPPPPPPDDGPPTGEPPEDDGPVRTLTKTVNTVAGLATGTVEATGEAVDDATGGATAPVTETVSSTTRTVERTVAATTDTLADTGDGLLGTATSNLVGDTLGGLLG